MLTASHTVPAGAPSLRRAGGLLWPCLEDARPDLLTRLMTFFRGCDDYVQNSPWRCDMSDTLRLYGRHEFRPMPSQAAVVGLLAAWAELRKVLLADDAFLALVQPNAPEDAADQFQSLKAALMWFRVGLDRDVRTVEARNWLDAIGWEDILALSEKRDQAAERLIAGKAVVSAEGDIVALPAVQREGAV